VAGYTRELVSICVFFLLLFLFQARLLMYIFCVAAQDKETQKKGCIFLWLDYLGQQRTHVSGSAENRRLGADILDIIPARINAVHVCVSNSKITTFFAMVRAAVDPLLMIRWRFHCGEWCAKCHFFGMESP
jgi:hypothetical protein